MNNISLHHFVFFATRLIIRARGCFACNSCQHAPMHSLTHSKFYTIVEQRAQTMNDDVWNVFKEFFASLYVLLLFFLFCFVALLGMMSDVQREWKDAHTQGARRMMLLPVPLIPAATAHWWWWWRRSASFFNSPPFQRTYIFSQHRQQPPAHSPFDDVRFLALTHARRRLCFGFALKNGR